MAIYRQLAIVGMGAAAILLVPLAAMQFTDEVRWDVFDFLVMGGLLCTVGGSYVLLSSRMEHSAQKFLLGVALALGLLTVWAELAVGVFGTPFAGS